MGGSGTDRLSGWRRTHRCGDLRASDIGLDVILMGWASSHRDHGGVIFVDLRDRWGITQVVFDPAVSKEVHKRAEHVRPEYVIAVKGRVRARMEGMANAKLATGKSRSSATNCGFSIVRKPRQYRWTAPPRTRKFA